MRDEIQGGVAAVFATLLRLFFSDADLGHDLRTTGMSLQLHDGSRRHLWCKLGPDIADEPAIATAKYRLIIGAVTGA